MTALVAALLLLSACGDATGSDATGSDPAASDPVAMPTAVPAAPGPVRSLNIATVLDRDEPQLCLAGVLESYPPQCGGPVIDGWRWADHRGTFESAAGVRWGAYAVTGTWDGERFGLIEAVTAALYDPMVQPTPTYPTPAKTYTERELADIAEEAGQLPGALGWVPQETRVHVDVIYDDGSLQAWADEAYGDGVVVVTSLLVDAEV